MVGHTSTYSSAFYAQVVALCSGKCFTHGTSLIDLEQKSSFPYSSQQKVKVSSKQ
jgi:hypothetical protein